MKELENKLKQLNTKNKRAQGYTIEKKPTLTDSESGSIDVEGVIETYLIEAKAKPHYSFQLPVNEANAIGNGNIINDDYSIGYWTPQQLTI